MRIRALLILAAQLVWGAAGRTQITQEVLGAHDLTPQGAAPIRGSVSASCLYCHAPHSGVGGLTPLWNQTLSTQTYTPYGSTSYNQKGNPIPPPGATSTLCLSCHDGTVAPGMSVAYGKMGMSGGMNAEDIGNRPRVGSNRHRNAP